MEVDINITLADLDEASTGALVGLLEQIHDVWVGEDEDRRTNTRCGTARISNEDGVGRVVIDLRFPVDLDHIRGRVPRGLAKLLPTLRLVR